MSDLVRREAMSAGRKLGLVAAGYVLAIAIAWVALEASLAVHPHPPGQDGMQAFGDGLFLLAVFSVVAVFPTGMGLYWMRPFVLFWQVSSAVALVVATAGVASLVVYLTAAASAQLSALLQGWAMLASLRMLLSPFCAGTFALFWLMSPGRRNQVPLLIAALAESAVTLYAFAHWQLGIL